MKNLKLHAMAMLLAIAPAATSSSANLLVNSGFEDPVTMDGPPFVGFWETFNAGPGSSANNSSAMPRSGAQHLEMSIVNTDNVFAGAFQDVLGVTPGVSTQFRLWLMTTSSPLDAGVEFRIEWRNSISGTEVSRTPNSTPIPTGVYTPFSLPAVVPVGADTARIVIAIETFGGSATNSGTVFVDDASFTVGDSILGDFDDDGDVDDVDYLTLSTNLHTDVSALSTDQSYLLGDMTLDLKINGHDFRGFGFAFDEANGAGAFVAMLAAVPEPSAGALAALSGCVAMLFRRSRARKTCHDPRCRTSRV